ncbi:hypothetical protein BU15DRAFT_70971 [Melanogaster broomeanus]|nr:hypothetical protein BU15DRAFT_70971 [Melanogaster broomeanus]
MIPYLAELPPEIYTAILTQVPREEQQQTVLSLTRAIPRSPVPLYHLFEYIRLKSAPSVVQLNSRLRGHVEEARWVKEFSLETWTVDADVIVNLLGLLPRLSSVTLFVGPNFAPEHMEEVLEKPRENLRYLSLRFRPYVQRATYYQFLKGAYFDTTLQALSRWPSYNFPSYVNRAGSSRPRDSSRAALCAALGFLPSRSDSHTGLQVALFIFNSPRSAPALRILDLSTCNIRLPDVEALLARFRHLRHLILDGCGITRGEFQDGDWANVGKLCALATVKAAKEREKKLKIWLEVNADHSHLDGGAVPEGEVALPRRVRRGRRGLAYATISLRDSPPIESTPVVRTGVVVPKVRVVPSSPSLCSLSTTANTLHKDQHDTIRAEFVRGWDEGLAQLTAVRNRLYQSWKNGVRMVRIAGDQGMEEGFDGLEDVNDESAFYGRGEGSRTYGLHQFCVSQVQNLGLTMPMAAVMQQLVVYGKMYPIKVASLDVKQGVNVQRGTRLLSYSFKYQPATPGARTEIRFGTWDCLLEGTVGVWKVRVGDEISFQRSKQKPVITILEPCKHGVQVGGLCGLCGKDMTGWVVSSVCFWDVPLTYTVCSYDYTGFSDASRASIQMTHSAFGPTVSMEEAQRIERATAEHLLKSRKLSLIVDLDQTIVHATVDPTVGEWITEGEVWEARQAKKASTTPKSDGSTSDSDNTTSDAGECNPNWDALKDVRKFRLGPESFGMPATRGSPNIKGKQKVIENEGCMYYIKPRPGLQDFLCNLSTKYEMHVYTMGTRAYAEEVCAAIDPDRQVFGGRILSRDESGSLTQKSLQRLFPCDTSMVVIIDDRADVWEWSPNLIKVIPYDFFVGIGDINSAFLPKVEPLAPAVHTPTLATPPIATTSVVASSSPSPLAVPEEQERAENESKALLTQNSLALEAQVEERPLAKKQEELQDETDAVTPTEKLKTDHPRKALLKSDDVELRRVRELLEEVHRRFFAAYNQGSPEDISKKRRLSAGKPQLSESYDVTRIIPEMRSRTLDGVYIVFSSVIPLDTKPETTEIWTVAHMFGARCYTELNNRITHVVAAKHGTVKVDMARKRGGINIVRLAWFTDSIALCQRQDETPYLLEDPTRKAPSLSPNLDPHQISSDPEPDADDWDVEPAPPGNTTYELADINWDDINDEVEAAMNESDDEDDDARSERSSVRSAMASDDDDLMTDDIRSQTRFVCRSSVDTTSELQVSPASRNSTPRHKRKRPRSVTPSESGNSGLQQDILRSPLSKRKKLAASRTGSSKLKEAFTADEVAFARRSRSRSNSLVRESLGLPSPVNEYDEDEGDDEDEDEDFLARELGEEWG